MMPVMHRNLQESIEILAAAARVFARKCIDGLSANEEFLRKSADLSPAIATRLNPIIGYERAAEIAKESVRTGIPVKELVVQKGILKREEAEKLLDPRALTERSKDHLGSGGG
jgi:aspartate ammonia-lyase